MMRRFICLTVFALVVWAVPLAAMAAVPSNDDLVDATSVAAIPYTDSIPVGEATTQPGEPLETCAPFANTVWYSVTLDGDTDVRIDTAGSDYDTTLAVWVGSGFDDATLVACNDDTFESLQSALSFPAMAGTTYLVQAGAFFEAPPDAVLQISFDKPKPGARPTVSRDQFRGSIADAFTESFDESTGTYTFQGAQVVDGWSKTKGMRPGTFSMLMVNTTESTFDETNQVYTYTDWFGIADLTPEQFSIDRRLAGASVTAALTLFGSTCVEDLINGTFECTDLGTAEVTANIEWSGQGPVIRSSSRSAEQFDGFRLRFSGRSTSRDAAVAGGASGEMDINLTEAVGRLANDANGSWFWAAADGGAGFFRSGAAGFHNLLEGTALAGIPSVMFDRFTGSFADAYQDSFDDETGTFSSRQVSLVSGRSKIKGQRWVSMDQVWVSSYAESFDEASQTATYTSWSGVTELAGDEFAIARRLGGAHVAVSVRLFGETCTYSYADDTFECVPIGETEVAVNATWVGEGPTSASSSSFQERVDGTMFTFRGRFSGRSATVSGEVTGDLVGWSLDGAFGQLGSQATGNWFKG
ncbi:MAG: hypothetical protein OEM84_14485 [Acidimicrobiia bacterium]|nr:hypothetical protein [Acidimicrobiia bacterium]